MNKSADSTSSNSRARKRRSPRQEQAAPPPPRSPADELMALFYLCGRCGAFLSGYRATVGQAFLEAGLKKSADNWITLAWGERLPLLLEKSYGFYLYSDTIHHEERCSECSRVLIYTVPDGVETETEGEGEAEGETGRMPVLQVQLYPALR